MRVGGITLSAMALALASCGGGSSSSAGGSITTEAKKPAPAPSPAPSPTPTPTPLPTTDGLVLNPMVPSLDSATLGARLFQGIPTIAQTGNRLWLAFYGDNVANWEGTGNYIILQYSDDGGKRWSREYYLVPQDRSKDRGFDPRLWQAPDGKLWVIYSQSGGGLSFDGQLGVWANVISDPWAKEPTFENGFWLADGLIESVFNYGGKPYLFIQYLYSSPSRFPERVGNYFYGFDWAGKRVTKVGSVPREPNSDYAEGQAVERKDGSLLIQTRSYDGIYQANTAPGALSIPSWARWTFAPSTYSRHYLGRTKSGRLVMVWNQANTKDRNRTDMSIAFSDDDGATWPSITNFDARDNVSYPDVTIGGDGTIYVAYDRQRTGTREIWVATITEPASLATPPSVKITLANTQRCTTAGSKCGPQ